MLLNALETQAGPELAPSTVYLVDDDQMMLEMLHDLIASIGLTPQIYSSGNDFLMAYRPMPSQCLVCDLRMPQIDGMTLQKRLAEFELAPPIIFLTGYGEVESAVSALKRGAFDFLEKRTFSSQSFLGKVQAALNHSRKEYAEWHRRRANQARLDLLTPKERSVLEQVIAGKTSREISEGLGLSVRTIEHHRDHIMQKLHVQGTVALVSLFAPEKPTNHH